MKSLLFLSLALLPTFVTPSTDFFANSRLANIALNQWYNTTSGLWETTGWWNSANCMTTLGVQAATDPMVRLDATTIFRNTYNQAPQFNEGALKVVSQDYMIYTFHRGISSMPRRDPKGFINGFYDDEGWWALAWIQAYDVTGRPEYLATAVDIFSDMRNATTTPCGGGIWWDRAQSYVNAIANELYLSVAAHLANRIKTRDRSVYLQIAKDQWSWFQKSGMINSDFTINDGLTADCVNNNGTVWSYNQGVILGGLVELNKASSDSSCLQVASKIAMAAVAALSDYNGVLHDPCEPDCGADGAQFKGIFMRNLRSLQNAAPNNEFLSYLAANAGSIWNHNRNDENQLSLNWAGPFISPANASTQSSAMDALIAASTFQKSLQQGIASM